MEKFAVTVATINGKLKVINGPDSDVDGQVKALRELTDAGGKIKQAKGSAQATDAVIVHSTKGRLKFRRF